MEIVKNLLSVTRQSSVDKRYLISNNKIAVGIHTIDLMYSWQDFHDCSFILIDVLFFLYNQLHTLAYQVTSYGIPSSTSTTFSKLLANQSLASV